MLKSFYKTYLFEKCNLSLGENILGIKLAIDNGHDITINNEVILDYVDIANKDNVANTDTAFVNKDRVAITNREHLALGYANGTFKNQA